MPRKPRTHNERCSELDDRLLVVEQNMQWMVPQVDDYRTWRQRAWGIIAAIMIIWSVISGIAPAIVKVIVPH